MMVLRLIVAGLLFSTPVAHAAPPPAITLSAGTTANFAPDGNGDLSAVLAAQTDSKAKGLPAVQVVAVVAKDGHEEQLLSAFKPSLAQVNSTLALLTIHVDAAKVADVLPGAYSLVLAVTKSGAPANAKPDNVTISVTRIAPQVVVPMKIATTEVLSYPGDSSPEEISAAVEVQETSRKSPALQLRFADYHDAPANGEVDAGRLSLVHAPKEIAAASAVSLAASTNGRFPLGTTTGKMEITSPDLAATVTVPFEVRVRFAKYWLAIVAAVGVFLGWYFRYYLAGRQQIAAARVDADDALDAFRSAFAAASDKTFRVSLNTAAEKVRDALKKNDAKVVAAAVKEAQDAITKAAADLETRLSPSATAVQAIRAVLLPAWRLPATIGSALNSARQELRNIEASIERHDADAATSALSDMSQTTYVNLEQLLVEFNLGLGKYLAALAVAPLTKDLRGVIAGLGDVVTKAYPVGATASPSPTNDKLRQSLDDTNSYYAQFLSIAQAAPADAAVFLKSAQDRLDAVPGGSAQKDATAAAAVAAFANSLAADAESMQSAALLLIPRLAAVRRAWVEWVEARAPGADPQALQDAVEKGTWLAAVDLGKAAVTQQMKVTALATGRTVGNLAGGSLTLQLTPPPTPTVTAATTGSTVTPTDVLKPTLSGTAGDRRRLRRINWVQSFIVGVLFVGGAYVSGEATWVGTPTQVLALLVLAFGVDLSTDGVIAALKGGSKG